MDFKNIELDKLYYTIGEVAEILNVNASLIRFWEKEFPMIKPNRNRNGNRQFTKEDVKIIFKIFDLVKINGLTLEGAKKILQEKSSTKTDRITAINKAEMIAKLKYIKLRLIKMHDKINLI